MGGGGGGVSVGVGCHGSRMGLRGREGGRESESSYWLQ